MNYYIRKTGPDTACLSIESSTPHQTSRKPAIWRFFPDATRLASMSTGAVLGRTPGKPCALIVNVHRFDLIVIRDVSNRFEIDSWKYYRIDQNYHPIPVHHLSGCISIKECATMLEITDTRELDQIDFRDETLRNFLSQTHPRWLHEIVQRQLLHWLTIKPRSFFKFAPRKCVVGRLDHCVKVAPDMALARFKDSLTNLQKSQCVIASPAAAISHVFDEIPISKRNNCITSHPNEALLFAANRLTIRQLKVCTHFQPAAAFRSRVKMSPNRRAIILAATYPFLFAINYDGPLTDLHDEIWCSILAFPERWIQSDPNGLPSLLTGLRLHVGMGLDSDTLTALLELLEPPHKQALVSYIASSI